MSRGASWLFGVCCCWCWVSVVNATSPLCTSTTAGPSSVCVDSTTGLIQSVTVHTSGRQLHAMGGGDLIPSTKPLPPPATVHVTLVDGGRGVKSTRSWKWGDVSIVVVDTYTSDSWGIQWISDFSSTGPEWGPAALDTSISFPNNPPTKVWAPYGREIHANNVYGSGSFSPSGYYSPFTLPRGKPLTFGYGLGLYWGSAPPNGTIALPLGTLFLGEGVGVTLLQSPRDFVIDMDLTLDPVGSIRLRRKSHRSGLGVKQVFDLHLVVHEECWRPGVGALVGLYPEYFTPHHIDHLWGSIMYADYRGQTEYNQTLLQELDVRVNWDATFPFPYWGQWLGTTSNFQTCVPVGHMDTKSGVPHPERHFHCSNFSYDVIREWYAAGERRGWSTLLYANIHEYGYEVQNTSVTLHCPPSNQSTFCQSNRLFRKFAAGFVDGTGYWPEWPIGPGVVLMDAANSAYQDFQVETLLRQLHSTPAAGACVDRSDHTNVLNPHMDDHISWGSGPTSWLGFGYLQTVSRLSTILHNRSQSLWVSATNPRLDLMGRFDGIYDEFGDMQAKQPLDGLLSLRKPLGFWNWDKHSEVPIESFLQVHLYYGATPTVPVPWADHTITPTPETTPYFLAYAPLFRLLAGKEWILLPHVVEVEDVSLWVNIFKTKVGIVVPIVNGTNHTMTTTVTVRHFTPKKAVVHYPSRSMVTIPGYNVGGNSTVFHVTLYKGCAVLVF